MTFSPPQALSIPLALGRYEPHNKGTFYVLLNTLSLVPRTIPGIQQMLNKRYYFVLLVDPSRKKVDLLAVERTRQQHLKHTYRAGSRDRRQDHIPPDGKSHPA